MKKYNGGGEEVVLRRDVRALSGSPSKTHSRDRVRLADLLRDFKHEIAI
jgi:hypothetical protein